MCWFAVTRVCFFEYTWPVGEKNYHFEVEKIALIFIYLIWLSSSSLRCTSCVYFLCSVHTNIINLAYFNPQNPQLVG